MKVSMRRLMALAMAGTMTLMAGCSQASSSATGSSDTQIASGESGAEKTASGDKTVIEYWHCNAETQGGLVVDDLVKKFNEENDHIEVVAKYNPDMYKSLMQNLQAEAATGNTPALVQIGWAFLDYFSNNFDYVAPQDAIDKFDSEDANFLTDNFLPNVLDLAVNSNGEQVGIPYSLSSPVLYINKDLLKEAGLSEDGPETWQEVQEFAEAVKEKAGKSTLLKVVAGVFKPTEGRVIRNGKIVPLLELGAGFDKNYTGRENIFLYGAVLGYGRQYMEEKYDQIVEFSGLEDFMDVPIKNYSSGMKSKLGFAIATIAEPEILILDEVLSVGDGKFRKKSEKKILDMMQDGTAVLFVSHSLAQVKRICNKAMILEGGKMIAFGDVDEVAQVYAEMTGELDELTVGQKNLVKKKNKKKNTEKIKQEDKREVMEES